MGSGEVLELQKNANWGRIRNRSKRNSFLPSPHTGGPEKLKVNCLVVAVKIIFKWQNNVVATNVAARIECDNILNIL